MAERALLLLHNPVVLAILTYDKDNLLEMVIDGLLENTFKRDSTYIKLLDKSGVFTQRS